MFLFSDVWSYFYIFLIQNCSETERLWVHYAFVPNYCMQRRQDLVDYYGVCCYIRCFVPVLCCTVCCHTATDNEWITWEDLERRVTASVRTQFDRRRHHNHRQRHQSVRWRHRMCLRQRPGQSSRDIIYTVPCITVHLSLKGVRDGWHWEGLAPTGEA